MEGGNTQRLTRNDALTYLNAVKKTLQDNKPTYDYFLHVMRDFKARRIDVAVVRKRVKKLFKDYKALLYGFDTFLPRGYEILVPVNEAHLGFDECLEYVKKIKKRFEGNDRVYKPFLAILTASRTGSTWEDDVCKQVGVGV